MATAKEILEKAQALSEEERLTLVGDLLETITPADPEIDAAWAKVAKQRLGELRSGKVEPISLDDFKKKYGQA